MSPPLAGPGEPVDHAVRWWLAYGHGFLPALTVLCFVLALVVAAPLWVLNGARIIAAAWVWRRMRDRWRRRRRRGGCGGHSSAYEAVLSSPGWRRRRRQAIRRAGRRCQRCGTRGPLEVHHLTYATLGRERPGDLLALCERCHGALHGRPGGD